MINFESETIRRITATVGVDSRFEGSAHDDGEARKLGFKSALVPGPAVASFMTHLLAEAWGEAWLERGSLVERQRRPVYEGDVLVATASAIKRDLAGLNVDIVLTSGSGEIVALATGALPDSAPQQPDLGQFPLRAHLPVPPAIGHGGSQVGDIYRTTPFVYTDEIHDDYLGRISETLPIYLRDRVVHPGYLVKLTMHDAVASFTRPTPGVHVGFTVQHFGVARVGDTLSSAGSITQLYEKKGRQYAESDQLVVANGQRPIAMVHRVSISSFGDGQ